VLVVVVGEEVWGGLSRGVVYKRGNVQEVSAPEGRRAAKAMIIGIEKGAEGGRREEEGPDSRRMRE
jgi:hypothetical protein